MITAKRQDAAAAAHRRKFRIDGPKEQLRLSNALVALEKNEEALVRALELVTQTPVSVFYDMKAALRLLVEGEKP